MEDLPEVISEWSVRNVSRWLESKGFGYSIMTRFVSEGIDGEALTLLLPRDLDTLLRDFDDDLKRNIIYDLEKLLQSKQVNPLLSPSPHKSEIAITANINHSPSSLVTSYQHPEIPCTDSIHSLLSSNHSNTLQNVAHSPPNHVDIFDNFSMEIDDRYRAASSSNSTFSALSQIPSETSTNNENIGEMQHLISVDDVHRIWNMEQENASTQMITHNIDDMHIQKECGGDDIVMKHIKKEDEDEILHINDVKPQINLNENDTQPQIDLNANVNHTNPASDNLYEEDDDDSSLEPILSSDHYGKTQHNRTELADSDAKHHRNKNRATVIWDDDSSDDEPPINQHIKKEKMLHNNRIKPARKRKRMHDDSDDDDQRPLKRMKVSTQNMIDCEERDADDEDDISVNLEQKESGQYAIRSHHCNATNTSSEELRARIKEKIMKLREMKMKKERKLKKEMKKEKKKEKKMSRTPSKQKKRELAFTKSDIVDKRAAIKNIEFDLHQKDPYRYSRENNHDLSNVGKRWKPAELEIIWNLHYEKNWSNMQIAEKFKRTECGIMVQIDKIYKDKRATQELINKKYLYHKKVDAIVKGEQKWSEKEHKWIKVQKDEESDDDDESSSSSDDDDEPIGLRIARDKIDKIEDGIGDKWDPKYHHNELVINCNKIIKREESSKSSAFLANIVRKGRHCWKFKVRFAASDSALFCCGLWNKTEDVRACDLSEFIGEYGKRAYVFDGYAACTNVYHLDDAWNEDYSYGVRIHNEDIVSMEVDFAALTLRFAVNEVDLGIAHYIECAPYSAAVSLANKDSEIELISYQNIIASKIDKEEDECTTVTDVDDDDDDDDEENLRSAQLIHLL